MLTRIVVVALLCLAPLPPLLAAADSQPASTPAADPQQQRRDVTGFYKSNWDDVRLVQKGDRVTGTYVCCGGGTIEGRIVEGQTLRYRWTQPTGSGYGVWTIRPGHLDGTWGSGQSADNGGRWDLVSARQDQIAQ